MIVAAPHLGSARAINDLKPGDLFVSSISKDNHVTIRVRRQDEDYDLILSVFSGRYNDDLPSIIQVGHVSDSVVRVISGDVRIAPIGEDMAFDYSTDHNNPAPHGAIALLPTGELVMKLSGKGRNGDWFFDLATGLGVNRPNDALWHRSWRILWGKQEYEREIARFPSA